MVTNLWTSIICNFQMTPSSSLHLMTSPSPTCSTLFGFLRKHWGSTLIVRNLKFWVYWRTASWILQQISLLPKKVLGQTRPLDYPYIANKGPSLFGTRLQSWRNSFLSGILFFQKVGLTLIQATPSNLPTYYLSLFPMPSKVAKELQTSINNSPLCKRPVESNSKDPKFDLTVWLTKLATEAALHSRKIPGQMINLWTTPFFL